MLCVMEPVMRLLRLLDAKRGVTVGNVYGYCLEVDAVLTPSTDPAKPDPLRSLPDWARTRLKEIFLARWDYFHDAVHTAGYILNPEYTRRPFTSTEIKELYAVFERLETGSHPASAMVTDFTRYKQALQAGNANRDANWFNERMAFSPSARTLMPYQWASAWLVDYPHLQYVAMRVGLIPPSASACETSWSLEGWFHNPRRNRMTQKTVERMMRLQSHLTLRDAPDQEAVEWGLGVVLEGPEDLEEGLTPEAEVNGVNDDEEPWVEDDASDEEHTEEPPPSRRRLVEDGLEPPSRRARLLPELDAE